MTEGRQAACWEAYGVRRASFVQRRWADGGSRQPTPKAHRYATRCKWQRHTPRSCVRESHAVFVRDV